MIAIRHALIAVVLCSTPGVAAAASQPAVPAGIEHADWTRLLQTWVDERGLVDYQGWSAHAEDRAALTAYLAQFRVTGGELAEGAERHAALINFYNAVTIDEVLRLEIPADGSYWSHDPFDDEEHVIGGVEYSLDDVEHRFLRPHMDYRVHATIVCAAISCPPLWREAYTADNLAAALDARMAVWLARDDLNQFDRADDEVRLSKIFDWFDEDFADPGIPTILARHGPEDLREWLRSGDYDIEYLRYDRHLNSQNVAD